MAYNYNVTTPDYSFKRVADNRGGFNYFYNGKPVTVEAYSTVSGIPRSAALSGSYTPQPTGIGNLYGNQSVSNTPITSTPYQPTYHTSWDTSVSKATKAITPYYTKQLSLSNQHFANLKAQEKATYGQNVQGVNTTYSQTMEDYGIQGQRTQDDTTTNLASLAAERKDYQGTEGRQAVKDRETALQELSQGTGIYGGAGQQQLNQADVERRATAISANRKYTEATGQQETFLTRTLADIAKGEGRAGEAKTTGLKNLKTNFDLWIEGWGIDRTLKKRELELDKQEKIISRAGSIWNAGYY